MKKVLPQRDSCSQVEPSSKQKCKHMIEGSDWRMHHGHCVSWSCSNSVPACSNKWPQCLNVYWSRNYSERNSLNFSGILIFRIYSNLYRWPNCWLKSSMYNKVWLLNHNLSISMRIEQIAFFNAMMSLFINYIESVKV